MMPRAVTVRSIEAITEAQSALLRLREDVQGAVVAARMAAQADQTWIAERKAHWQRRVTTLAEELIEAEAALARCRSKRRSAGSDGCRSIAEWATRTRKQLWEAESELRTVQRWERILNQHIAGVERRLRVMVRELADHVPPATAELIRITELLEGYAGH